MMFEKQPGRHRQPAVARTTFKPPKERLSRNRIPRMWPPDDWRSRVPPAMLRAFNGASFAALGAFTDRFGNATLPLACVALAIFAGMSAYVIQRSEAHESWPIAAVDALALVLIIPLVAVASDVMVADQFLGGGTERFVAASVAVSAAALIIWGLAAFHAETTVAPLAFLSVATIVSAGFVGAARFSADAFADGVSLAWMVAAVATMADGLVTPRLRALVPIGTGAAFLLLMILLAQGDNGVDVPSTSILVGLLSSAGLTGLLLCFPMIAEQAHRDRN